MVNRIVLNETSYHGAGAIQEIATEVTKRGFKKAFVCSDPDLVKFGVTKKVTDVLDNAGLAYEVYSQIKPNPTIENVQTGVAAFKAAGADYLIAIGGGSSMDTAKAVGIIINNPEFEDVRSLEGVADTKKPCVPIIAVPTTAGTAAEVTINYVITDNTQAWILHMMNPSGPRNDVFYAKRVNSSNRYGCINTCHRRIHNKSSLGNDRYVPYQSHRTDL